MVHLFRSGSWNTSPRRRRFALFVSFGLLVVQLPLLLGCLESNTAQPPRTINLLRGVAASSPTDIWAVGEASLNQPAPPGFSYAAKALIVHWDGQQWQLVPSPSPGVHSSLMAVTALSATDAWAVGSTWDDHAKASVTLIEHWEGHQWQRVPSPNQEATPWSNELRGVAAHSASDLWAVGSSYNAAGEAHPLIEHWDGRAWQILPGPSQPQMVMAFLNGVVALSASDVWAVGVNASSPAPGWREKGSQSVVLPGAQPLLEHWDGKHWVLVNSDPLTNLLQPSGLYAVGALPPRDIWAVGECHNNELTRPLVAHWDGQQQSVINCPTPPETNAAGIMNAVAVRSATDIWAVGLGPLAEHWDGTTWQVDKNVYRASNPATGPYSVVPRVFWGVTALSADDLWVVGTTTFNAETVIDHWDGTTWRRFASPDPGESQ